VIGSTIGIIILIMPVAIGTKVVRRMRVEPMAGHCRATAGTISGCRHVSVELSMLATVITSVYTTFFAIVAACQGTSV
jgi:hypothetical protein